MTEQNHEPDDRSDSKPEPLKVDTPVYDYIEKGDGRSGHETREIEPDEEK